MDGDIIIADTAEDETAGKCVEIGNLTDSVVVSGLHTMAQRPKFEFGKRYLGVYMNSVSYHKQLLPLMQGIKVISISKTAIASTIIVYPQKIEEQNKIGAIFKIISNLLTLDQKLSSRHVHHCHDRFLFAKFHSYRTKTVPLDRVFLTY